MYESLKLDNQICFPLYACAKEVVKKYQPFLKELDLTYTQYIVMLVMWEQQKTNVKQLGERLFLDSGTLTPLLKKLESQGFIERSRSASDERQRIITLSSKGTDLELLAKDIPQKVGSCIPLSKEEALTLYTLLYKVLQSIKD